LKIVGHADGLTSPLDIVEEDTPLFVPCPGDHCTEVRSDCSTDDDDDDDEEEEDEEDDEENIRRRHAVPAAELPYTLEEECSYELLTLLDDASAPRYLYPKLLALLRKQSKYGIQVKQYLSREKLLKKLKGRFVCPTVKTSVVRGRKTFKFSLKEQLQDILTSRSHWIHHIDPSVDGPHQEDDELWNTEWLQNTCRQRYPNFDMTKERIFPIILYTDKTGTDSNSRFTLEPVLVSVANIPRDKRNDSRSWRHLGFVPALVKDDDDNDENQQIYHDYMSSILSSV
jgi:hypothetical protein